MLITSAPFAAGHDVDVTVEGIDATVGTDVSPGSFSNEVEGIEVLTITADDLAEGDEQFTFTPDPESPLLVGIPTTFTILDDDDGTIGARRGIVAEATGLTPGGFRSRAPTNIGFVAGDGSVRPLATPTAATNGRVGATLTVPRSTPRGDRQLVVTGPGTTRDRVRSFDLRVAGSC